MLYVIEHIKGGVELSKKIAINQETEQAMKMLGELIAECRGNRSLRKIAEPSGIPASQLQYIERGIMTPTADVYSKLLKELAPDISQQKTMDDLYMTIRKTPPPNICNTIISNQALVEAMRCIDGITLTLEQSEEIRALFASIATKNK